MNAADGGDSGGSAPLTPGSEATGRDYPYSYTNVEEMSPEARTAFDAAQVATETAEILALRRTGARSSEDAFEQRLLSLGLRYIRHPVVVTRGGGGVRIPDFAVWGPNGLYFVEVKTGRLAAPVSSQIRKDRLIEEQGFIGLSPGLLGLHGPTPVQLERRVLQIGP